MCVFLLANVSIPHNYTFPNRTCLAPINTSKIGDGLFLKRFGAAGSAGRSQVWIGQLIADQVWVANRS